MGKINSVIKVLTTALIILLLFSLIGCAHVPTEEEIGDTHIPTKEEHAVFYIQKAEQLMLEKELSYTNIEMEYTKDISYDGKTWHQYNLIACLNLQDLDYAIIADLLNELSKIYNPDYKSNLIVTKLVELKTQVYELINYSLCEYPKHQEVYNLISAKKGVNLTRDEKEYICKKIDGLYEYYDKKEGRPTGDRYSTVIFEEISGKYCISVASLLKIWRERYL